MNLKLYFTRQGINVSLDENKLVLYFQIRESLHIINLNITITI